jgi:hypothetical protein
VFAVNLESKLTDAQQKLLVDVRRAYTVVNVVFERKRYDTSLKNPHSKEEKSHPGPLKHFANTVAKAQHEVSKFFGDRNSSYTSDFLRRRLRYLRYLEEIALIGTGPHPSVPYANSLLDLFKNDFVTLECDFVKNRYVTILGLHALGIGFLFLLPYIVLEHRVHHGFFHSYKSFLILAAAACAGTWLSFSLRRVTLGFTDLANLEEDRLKPTSRLLFVIGLTWVIALFIATKIIDFKIGGVAITEQLFHSGTVAVLMGVLCGISERALAGVVSRRSDDVIGGLSAQEKTREP